MFKNIKIYILNEKMFRTILKIIHILHCDHT